MNMEERRIPGSVRSVEDVAPWLIAGAGGSITIALLTAAPHFEEALITFLVMSVPIATMAIGANRFAAKGGLSGVKTLVLGVSAYASVGGVIAASLGGGSLFWIGPVLAVMIAVFVFALSLPPLLMAYAFGKSRARDAGDTMLLWGSVWSAVLHALCIMLTWDHPGEVPLWAALAGFVVSLLVLGAATARAQNRRTFARLAILGKVPGYRVRTKATVEELRELPPLYSVHGAPRAVLERVMVSMEGSAYRGGITSTPVAVIPLATR